MKIKVPTSGQWVEVSVIKPADLIFDNFLTAIGIINSPLQIKSTARMVVQ